MAQILQILVTVQEFESAGKQVSVSSYSYIPFHFVFNMEATAVQRLAGQVHPSCSGLSMPFS
jgi:hypothetical protein